MNNIGTEISNNLYAFYDHISRIGGIDAQREGHWSIIRNVPGAWPRIIYSIDPEIVKPSSSLVFEEKVNAGTYPEILIASDQNIREIDPFLRARGFYPFSAWKGMAIKGSDVIASDLAETIEVVKIESSEDMDQWLKVVTSQLIAPARLDKALLERLLLQPGMEAFLLKVNGVGVSTILVFTSETSRGLYLIATEKSAQRQGFAKWLVQWVLSRETLKSNLPIVLHATPRGETLYSKLGFLPFNQFFLYRFLKTNP